MTEADVILVAIMIRLMSDVCDHRAYLVEHDVPKKLFQFEDKLS